MNCWDNACSETLFGSLKVELLDAVPTLPSDVADSMETSLGVLLDDIDQTADIEVIARRILTSISTAYVLNGQNLYTTTSIGVTTSLLAYQDADAVIRDADAAMYEAKAQGKNRYCFFDQSLHQNAMNRLKLEADLRHAIDHGEIVVYYQPIYDLA